MLKCHTFSRRKAAPHFVDVTVSWTLQLLWDDVARLIRAPEQPCSSCGRNCEIRW